VCVYPVFPAVFVEEAIFSPSCVLGSFGEDHLAIDMWVYVWIFYSDPLFFLSVFVPIPGCFYCMVLVAQFEVRCCASSTGFFSPEFLWLF
jgi:hypothetical protein